MNKPPVLVSACLLGLKTRYNGGDAYSDEVVKLLQGRVMIPVCPEQLGGLSTPRPKAEIEKGDGAEIIGGSSRVIDESGRDVTTDFLNGANAVLKIARLTGAKEAFLKEKSPSCGVTVISRGGEKVPGMGVSAALLEKEGIKIRGF